MALIDLTLERAAEKRHVRSWHRLSDGTYLILLPDTEFTFTPEECLIFCQGLLAAS